MQLKISVKQPGKKHLLIDKKIIEIDDIGNTPTVYELINAVVKQQVQEYNDKPAEKNLLSFLNRETIERDAENGKVGFGSIYNENKAVVAEAQQTAVQAFEDGIFVLFADDQEYTKSGAIIHLTEDSILTFVRLTFLAGSYW
jgi:hypothetical protein